MTRGTAIIVTTVLVLLTGVLLVVFAFRLGDAPTDEVFVVGPARTLADDVPLLFQDLRGGDLDIWVTRVDGRWTAFATHRRGAPRRCQVEWRARSRQFRDPCTGTVYPADGGDLPRYTTRVDNEGQVVVDFSS